MHYIRGAVFALLLSFIVFSPADAQTDSLWSLSTTPANANDPDASSVELGVKLFSGIQVAFVEADRGHRAVNGVCGSSNGVAVSTAPSTNLCSAGTASNVTGSGPWSWSCAGSKRGTTALCSAQLASQPPVNGQCGPANGVMTSTAPTSGLCSAGTPSTVTGSGPWNWTCAGSNGSATATCTAPVQSSGGSGSLLPPDRDASANWRMAGLLSTGGIPSRNTICATVNPLGGGRDDAPNINAAIAACVNGQVVNLAAGTFTINEGSSVLINKGVTLRGAGAGTTILTRTDGATDNSYFPGSNPSNIITLGGGANDSAGVLLSADGAQGSYSITVASAAGLSVGQFVLIDEASGAGWQPERNQAWVAAGYSQIWASPDYRVVWQKHNPYYQYVDDFDASTYPYQSGSAGCWFSNCDRPTNEMHQISAISGNTVTFDSPLTISYRASHQATLYGMTGLTQNAGVENLSVSYGDNGNINIYGCAYCWALNVENSHYLNSGFNLNQSFRSQLEGVYIHNAAWPVNGGAGYNISIAWGSSELLIENSISVLANKVMVDRSAGAGSVVAYNYMDDGYINGEDSWVEIGINGSHMVGGHHLLFEGNQTFNADSDTTHGNSIYMTFFRNWLTGFRKPFTALDGAYINDAAGCCGPMRTGSAHVYSYWLSYLGNVLGTPGQMSGWTYEDDGGTNRFPNKAIWTLGYADISPQGTDPNVAATALRDGNYDFVTSSVVWAANDTTHTLPNSLYLTQAPAFFNAGSGYAWPWVNPTGAPVLYTLPAKARYDAGTPFTQP